MPAKPTSTPIRKAPLFTPYVVVWSMFGLLSFGLLSVLGLAPEWLDDLRPSATFADPQGNQGQRAAARLSADVDQLKTSVSQMQLDLAQIRTDVLAQGEQQKTMNSVVADLRSRLAPSAVAEGPKDSGNANEAATTKKPAEAKPDHEMTSTSPVSTARNPRVINADATTTEIEKADTKIETGSLKKPESKAITFGPAIVKPVPQNIGIKLSTGASVDSLRLSWAMLSDMYSDRLNSLKPRYATAGNSANPAFDLIAGPIKSKSEAEKLCKSLSADGVPCSISTYTGNAL